jgi:hypothetical protein
VISDPVVRNSFERVIDGVDAELGELAIVRDADGGLEHVPPVDQPGIIDLQDKSGIDDRPVLFAQRLGQGEDELLVAAVVFVVDEMVEPARSDHAEERLLDLAAGARGAAEPGSRWCRSARLDQRSRS